MIDLAHDGREPRVGEREVRVEFDRLIVKICSPTENPATGYPAASDNREPADRARKRQDSSVGFASTRAFSCGESVA